MSENVGVSRAKLISTANAIRDLNASMSSHLTGVNSTVTALNASWQSEASKKLNTIAANMQDKFVLLRKEVETFAAWLDSIASNYQTQESAATDTLSSIDSMFK